MKKKNKLLKFILFVLSVIGLTYAINLFIEFLATRRHKLSSSPEDYYHWKDSRIYFNKEGSGKPLLLLHDLNPSSSAYEWEKAVDLLAENHTVYVLDLPGCGRSSKEKITYVGYYYVQLIHSFISDIIGEKTDIAATCGMTSIALSACQDDTGLIDKLILVNPVSVSSQQGKPSEKAEIGKKLLELPILGTLVYNIEYSRSRIDLAFTETNLYNPFHTDANTTDVYYEAAHLGNAGGRYLEGSLMAGYLNVDPTHALNTVKNNISIIGGRNYDGIAGIIQEYEGIYEGVRNALIPNSKKLPQLEEPAAFVNEMERLLEGS